MGQCNDAYSAVVVAQALAGALKTDVNGERSEGSEDRRPDDDF